MMSKLKKNKKLIIGLIVVVLCFGIFFFVKEKYIENTTIKLFHDNNQKMKAPADACKKLFGDESGTIDPEIDIYLATVDGKDETEWKSITCTVDQKVLDKYGAKNGIEFDVVSKKGVKSVSSKKFVCKAKNVEEVKIQIENEKNWRVDVNLTKRLYLDDKKESYCEKDYTGAVFGTIDSQKGSVGGKPDSDDGLTITPPSQQGDTEATVSNATDGYYDPDFEETDETVDADSLPSASNEVHNVAADKVQFNDKPWKNTSNIGGSYNTFTYMQTHELGWSGDTYEGKPAKRNLLTDAGNHAVFPDDDSAEGSYVTRKNIIDDDIEWQEGGGKQTVGVKNLNCNYDLSTDQIAAIKKNNQQEAKDKETGELSNYYYDKSNTTYFYGAQKQVIDKDEDGNDLYVKYYAHTNGGLRDKVRIAKEPVKCTKICQEIVKVEYGPPVYVNAAMCFEYRVKATSIVRCKTVKADVKKPSKYKKQCLPSPVCYHGKTKSRQGGPNEDFEECVKSCDGGMYSKECSNKCYKEVYGNPQQALQDLAIQKMVAKAELLATTASSDRHAKSSCPSDVYGGHYYRSSGSVKYCQSEKQSTGSCEPYNGPRNDAGLWYILANYSVVHYSNKYAATSNGLIKACQGGHLCADTCYWTGCSDDKRYLMFDYSKTMKGAKCDLNNNYGTYVHINKDGDASKPIPICTTADQIEADYEENLVRYRRAKEKCKTKTVCTTTTAEFRIGFKYSMGDKNVVVNFPYSATDKLPTDDSSTGDKIYTDDGKTSLLSYGGCYGNSGNLRWYQAEWTFPGTYFPDKGDGISYVPTGDTTDLVAKGLVCFPQGINDTNIAWGRQYYGLAYNGETYANVTETKTSETIKKLRNGWKCTFKKKNSVETFADTSANAEGYNIHASSINFGFFKWKFNVNCFYSLLNDPTKITLDKSKTDRCYNVKEYSTDNQVDTFNSSDPLLTNERVQFRGKNSSAFNWKKEATLVHMTEGGYDTNPELLLEKIKTDSNTFEKPEFKFRLTADSINMIKQYNKKYTLGKFDVSDKYKDTLDRNGVTYYRSYFLRDYMGSVAGFRMSGSGEYDQYVGINNTKYPTGIKD